MGCDGGSIPKRSEQVKEKKREEKPDKNIVNETRWLQCALTQEPLREPIVACELGFLYNKESLLQKLIQKSIPAAFSHIRSLKDVRVVTLTPSTSGAGYMCPITLLEANGHHRFCLLWSCGCVLSERALREVPSTACIRCGQAFTAEDVLPLNGTELDVQTQREKLDSKRAAERAKREKRKAKGTEGVETPAIPPPDVIKPKKRARIEIKPTNQDLFMCRA